MRLIITEDNKFLRIVDYAQEELDQINFSLKRRIRSWRFNPLVKKKIWDGYVHFCRKKKIPIGLWDVVIKIGEQFGFEVIIEGLERIIGNEYSEEDFKKWAKDFFKDHPKFKPRDYQIESASYILKYRLCTSEIATSAGKTLTVFMVYAYLKHIKKINKMVIIVPNTTLVFQLKDDWEDYANNKISMNIRQVYGGTKDNDPNAEVIIGTFQSLCKKTLDFYKGVDIVFVDECHQANVTSIKNIISKCTDSVYRFGLSGTIREDDSADFMTITSLLGPVVKTISPKFLFTEGYATPVKFKVIVLKYASEKIRKKLYELRRGKSLEGSQLLALEKDLVVKSNTRFDFVTDMISKTTKNSMALFSNVKDQYGRRIYEYLKEHTDKTCFYVDGSVDQEKREYFKKEMEKGDNKILVASFTTFSTGISIKNIFNIFFTESYKSEIIIKQSIGRGMRQMSGKEAFNIIDFVDDFSYNKRRNYLLRHGAKRLEIYKEYSSDISVHQLSL